MSSLKQLTEKYVSAFDNKDLGVLEDLLHTDVVLTDPDVEGLTPRSNVLKMMSGLFMSFEKRFSFFAKNIFEDGEVTLIEFELCLDDKTLKGVDVIHWSDGKIIRLDAYLY